MRIVSSWLNPLELMFPASSNGVYYYLPNHFFECFRFVVDILINKNSLDLKTSPEIDFNHP